MLCQIIDIGSTMIMMMPFNYNNLTRDIRLMVLIMIILYTRQQQVISGIEIAGIWISKIGIGISRIGIETYCE